MKLDLASHLTAPLERLEERIGMLQTTLSADLRSLDGLEQLAEDMQGSRERLDAIATDVAAMRVGLDAVVAGLSETVTALTKVATDLGDRAAATG